MPRSSARLQRETILGIDPGSLATGWGLVEVEDRRLHYQSHGVIGTSPSAGLAERLSQIYRGLHEIIEHYHPTAVSLEKVFLSRNVQSALKLGQARGIAMLIPARAGLAVAEYAPNLVKKTIVGAGHAEKGQIRMMIGVLLPKADPRTDDAADALAIAVTHAHHRQSAVLRIAAG